MKRVMVISLNDDTVELQQLARSMEYDVVSVHVQRRQLPDHTFYIGKGKVEKLAPVVKTERIDTVLFNHDLRPIQLFNLEKQLGCPVFDRTRLILEIFADRAKDQEAKLQVELARLQYLVPYVKELVHRAKTGEHAGYMGGGEYQVDQYLKIIKKKIRDIKDRLGSIVVEREAKRRHRREGGFFLISIAGYTNAGKSSLLANVTDAKPIIEERYFSTLYPSTRRGKKGVPGNQMLLFTDTVGFISGLPPAIIESFRSTVEEIYLSDLVLFIIDMTDNEDDIVHKILTGLSYIRDGGGTSGILYVFNKIDRVQGPDGNGNVSTFKENLVNRLHSAGVDLSDHVLVSCTKKEGIDELMSSIIRTLSKLPHVHHLIIEGSRDAFTMAFKERLGQNLIGWLFSNTMVFKFSIPWDGSSPFASGNPTLNGSFEILCKEKEFRKLMDINLSQDSKLSIIDYKK